MNTSTMNILFVSPYPPSRIRSRGYGFLQELRHKHNVTVLAQVGSEQELRDAEVLERQGYEIISVRESRWLSLMHSSMALLSPYPLQAAYARSSQLLHKARQLVARRHFDIVHVEHLRGMASMEVLANECSIVWDAVDCISRLWEKVRDAHVDFKTTVIASLEQERTKLYEKRLLEKVSHVLAISERDRQALAILGGQYTNDVMASACIDVVPNGVDLDYFTPALEVYKPYSLVFSGKMSYHANIAAAQHLYQDIMPLIWKELPMATLTIVGSKPPKSIQAWQSDARISVTGYVDDIRPYIQRAHVMISPLVYSVGMQNKVVEAMALGTPTVISDQSAAALAVRSGYDTLVATSARSFAEKAVDLMTDTTLREAISVRGRRYVEKQHDWRCITDRLVDIYRSVLARNVHVDLVPFEKKVSALFKESVVR
jgi:polysaccharide biosynthesis protein PslH